MDAPTTVSDTKTPAIARAAAILRLLGRSPVPLGVNAIARELALVPSTCLYVLRALVAESLVAFDPHSKRYALDAGVLALARGWLKRNQFADLSANILNGLAGRHGVTMLAVQLVADGHMVVVSTALGGGAFPISVDVGSRFPELISATGRLTAAYAGRTEAVLKRDFARLRWDSPPDFSRWLDEVEQARARGFAIDDGSYIAGVMVLAVPVWTVPGQFRQALVAVGVADPLRHNGPERIVADMQGEAARLAEALTGD